MPHHLLSIMTDKTRTLTGLALITLCAMHPKASVAEITNVGEAAPQVTIPSYQQPLASAGSEDAQSELRCYQGGAEIITQSGYQYLQLGQNAQQGAIVLRTVGDKNQLTVIELGDTVCTINMSQ